MMVLWTFAVDIELSQAGDFRCQNWASVIQEMFSKRYAVYCKFYAVHFIQFVPWVALRKSEVKLRVLFGQCSLESNDSPIDERIMHSVSSNLHIAATVNRVLVKLSFVSLDLGFAASAKNILLHGFSVLIVIGTTEAITCNLRTHA